MSPRFTFHHGQGVVTAYLHASKLRAAEGQKVKRGDILAEVGSTGISTSDHLHFGVYLHDVPVNPLRWLAQFEPD
jgi:murein DD-endopeptidase MepM/ murein hydrolase activator NlpD